MSVYTLRLGGEFLKGFEPIDTLDYPTAITVGNFDGVHIGHRYLIEELKRKAKVKDLKPVVLGFYPHPLKVLSPNQAPCELTNAEERASLLLSSGVHACVFIKFTREFSRMRAEDFLKHIVYERLRCKFLLVGYDWRFGYRREGEIELAREVGRDLGFEVELAKPYKVDGHVVSSTLVRRLLHQGRLDEAVKYLGRKYYLVRRVIRGDGRGSKIGYPTANLEGSDNLCLREGVYAVKVDDEHLGIANYGYRPTFGGKRKVLEVHIIGKSLNLYGKKIKVEFLGFVREERKFAGISELIKQIEQDILSVSGRYL